MPTSNRVRWMMLISGSAVMLIIGTIYSWALFTQPLLVLFHWNLTTATLAFSIANFCLAAIGACTAASGRTGLVHAGLRWSVSLCGVQATCLPESARRPSARRGFT
jgi:hypothetical protein